MRMIGKSDGPTAVAVIKRNSKLTLKQKLEKCKYKMKRAYVEHTIKAESHRNDNMHIIIEKRFAYIGGGVSGDKKQMRKFHRIFKDVHRYYGVTA